MYIAERRVTSLREKNLISCWLSLRVLEISNNCESLQQRWRGRLNENVQGAVPVLDGLTIGIKKLIRIVDMRNIVQSTTM